MDEQATVNTSLILIPEDWVAFASCPLSRFSFLGLKRFLWPVEMIYSFFFLNCWSFFNFGHSDHSSTVDHDDSLEMTTVIVLVVCMCPWVCHSTTPTCCSTSHSPQTISDTPPQTIDMPHCVLITEWFRLKEGLATKKIVLLVHIFFS